MISGRMLKIILTSVATGIEAKGVLGAMKSIDV